MFIIVSVLVVLGTATAITSIVKIEKAHSKNSDLVDYKPAADINSKVLVAHFSHSGNIDGKIMSYFF